MAKKFTQEDFIACSTKTMWTFDLLIQKLVEKFPDYFNNIEIINIHELQSLTSFNNEKTIIRLRCKIDGYEWNSCGKRMLLNQRCRRCSGSYKLSHDEFIQSTKVLVPYNDQHFIIKNKYNGRKKDLQLRCKSCGFEFKIVANTYLTRDIKCPNCQGGKLGKHTVETIIQQLSTTNWQFAESITSDIDMFQPIKLFCKNCGYVISIPLRKLFSQGYSCPNCCPNARTHTKEYYETIIKEKFQLQNLKFLWSEVDVSYMSDIKIFNNKQLLYQGSLRNCLNRNSLNGNNFTKSVKLSILSEYDLTSMSTHQLLELIASDVLPKEWEKLTYTEPNSDKRKNSIEELKDLYSNSTEDDEESNLIIEKQLEDEAHKLEKEYSSKRNKKTNLDDEIDDSEEDSNFPELEEKTLKNYSKAFKNLVSLGDKHKLIAEVEIHKIWNAVLRELTQKSDKTLSMLSSMERDSEWLSYVHDTFFTEFKEVNDIQVDKEYAFPYQPSLMQKLMVYRLMKNQSYGNWCGTGAGKTNAALLSTRLLNCKNNVIICPNSVISSWKRAIQAIYPNSNVIVYKDLNSLTTLDKTQFNYIIFNVEKFQINSRFEMIDELIKNNVIDFICFDEIQQMKVRNEKNMSNRYEAISYLRSQAFSKNNNMYVLGMTATPLINNLQEVKSILELITGKEYSEIENKNTLQNIHLAYKGLLLNGFRYIPDYNINVNIVKPKVKLNDEDVIKSLTQYRNGDVDKIEHLLTEAKLNAMIGELTPKTILYTHYHSNKGILKTIKRVLDACGISCAFYAQDDNDNSDRDQIINDFKNGKFDVLVASSPISTGVNGLQEISNKMVILSLPWTSAEYQQLLGRINRQGSIFDSVDIIIPQVTIETKNNEEWSWDVKRYKIIEYKRTLSDAVIDGVFCETFELDKKALLKQAIESLQKGIEDYDIQRDNITVSVNTEDIEIKKRKYRESLMNDTHRHANTSSSSHMHSYFKSNPQNWIDYHKAREENKKTWLEDPLDVIADMLNRNTTNPNQVIADLGCGMNQLKTKVNDYKKWYSFDHYSEDSSVIHADISNLNEYLPNDSVDVAVFCMSLWGTNYMDYIEEASRYVKIGGVVYIAEPVDNIDQAVLFGESPKYGFRLMSIENDRNGKTYITFKRIN